jgi:nicotinamidase-related amidase
MNTALLIIDPQNSFCTQEPAHAQQILHSGELFVPGANDDMYRLSQFIRNNRENISKIYVTMDSHGMQHIAHPCYWIDENGNNPEPFTILFCLNDKIIGKKMDGTVIGEFKTKIELLRAWGQKYVQKVFEHIIWPPHCLVGTEGHNIVRPLIDELIEWERVTGDSIDYFFKGKDADAEMFSAVKDVLGNEPEGALHDGPLFNHNQLLVAGEAMNFCVASTVRDLINDRDELARKVVLLRDCTSNVPSREDLGNIFLKEMTEKGMLISNTKDFTF